MQSYYLVSRPHPHVTPPPPPMCNFDFHNSTERRHQLLTLLVVSWRGVSVQQTSRTCTSVLPTYEIACISSTAMTAIPRNNPIEAHHF